MREEVRRCWRRVTAALDAYCGRGCLVGTRYLVQPGYHWTERLFWAICLALGLLGCLGLVRDYHGLYSSNVSRLVAEDNPPATSLPFPSVGLCETGRWASYVPATPRWELPGGTSAAGPHAWRLRRVLKALVFQNLLWDNLIKAFVREATAANRTNAVRLLHELQLEPFARKVRASCSELFVNCSWNHAPFECCAHFRPLKTPHGTCFMLNSRLTEGESHLNMTVTKHSELSVLRLNFTRDTKVFVLPDGDVPEALTPLPKFTVDAARHAALMGIVMTPFVVDPGLVNFGPEATNCVHRQDDWVPGLNHTYRLPSYGACLADCVRMLQQRACGCINYVLNRGRGEQAVEQCDLDGYLCLEKARLLHVAALHQLRDTPCRRCLPSCSTYFVKVAHFEQRPSEDFVGDNRSLAISLLVFPPKRLHLQTIRDPLDVLVSLGGILSLFLGFSLTSVLEFLFVVVCRQPTLEHTHRPIAARPQSMEHRHAHTRL